MLLWVIPVALLPIGCWLCPNTESCHTDCDELLQSGVIMWEKRYVGRRDMFSTAVFRDASMRELSHADVHAPRY